MSVLIEALSSFAQTRWMSRKSISRSRFETLQARALEHWLLHDVPKVDAYRDKVSALSDLPVVDKAAHMANFAAYNSRRISCEQVREAMQSDFRIGDLTVGASTGTSGNRGYFVISERERFRWLGSIIAKTIADMVHRRQRIAIMLPQGGALYDSAKRIRQIELLFLDLFEGVGALRKQLEAFNPTVIVAPPKVLRFMVEEGFDLKPRRVFSAAETLDATDVAVIEGGLSGPLRQIYMATEGLFGVSCSHGRLHLAEDSVFFEFDRVGEGLVNPIVSCFRRQTQILARYRMNDLLRLSEQPCSCGSPLRAVDEVVGRMDDCFHLKGGNGDVFLTPDVLRNLVLKADRRIDDFRLIQTKNDLIELVLKPDCPDEAAKLAARSIEASLRDLQADCRLTVKREPLTISTSRKLRRVERRIFDGRPR